MNRQRLLRKSGGVGPLVLFCALTTGACGAWNDDVSSENSNATQTEVQQTATPEVIAAAVPITSEPIAVSGGTITLSKAEAAAQVYIANYVHKAQQDPFLAVAGPFVHEVYAQDPDIDPDKLAVVIRRAKAMWRERSGVASQQSTEPTAEDRASAKLAAQPLMQSSCTAEVCAAATETGPGPVVVVKRLGQMVLNENLAILGALLDSSELSIDLKSTPMPSLNVGTALRKLVPVFQDAISWRQGLLQSEEQWQQVINKNTAPIIKDLLRGSKKEKEALDKSVGSELNAKTSDNAQTIAAANPELSDASRSGSAEVFSNIQPDGTLQIDMNAIKEAFSGVMQTMTVEVIGGVNAELSEMSEDLEDVLAGQDKMLAWMAAQDLRLAKQEAAQAQIKLNAMKMEAAQSTVYMLSTIAGFVDPKLGHQIGAVGSGAIKIADALNKFSEVAANSDLAGFGAAICTGNLLSAAVSIASAFMETGPTTDELILEGLGQLSQQISGLRDEMHDRFDRVDQQLTKIYDQVDAGFAKIATLLGQQQLTLNKMIGEMELLRQDLSDLHRNLQSYLDAGFRRELTEALGSMIGYEAIYGEQMPYASQVGFTGTEKLFYAWSTENASDSLSAGPDDTSVQPGEALGIWDMPLAYNINYVAAYPSKRFGLPALSIGRVSNPLDLAISADGWVRLLEENPNYRQRMPGARARLVALSDVVQQLEDTVKAIAVVPAEPSLDAMTSNTGTPNFALWRALFDDYDQSINDVQAAITAHKNSYKSTTMSQTDIWSSASTVTAPAPTLQTPTMDWCDGRPAGLAIPTALLERGDIKRMYYAADAAGLGKVSACLADVSPVVTGTQPVAFLGCRTTVQIDVTVKFQFKAADYAQTGNSATIGRYTLRLGDGSIVITKDSYNRVEDVKWQFPALGPNGGVSLWSDPNLISWQQQNAQALSYTACGDAIAPLLQYPLEYKSEAFVIGNWSTGTIAPVVGGWVEGTLKDAFETNAQFVSPSKLESMVRAPFESQITEQLDATLRNERRMYYMALAAELDQPASELWQKTRTLNWYKEAIKTFVATGLSRALAQHDMFRALLLGPYGLFDRDVLRGYLLALGTVADPPAPEDWITVASARSRALVSDDQTNAPGIIDRMLVAIANGEFVEGRPMYALLRFKLDMLKKTIDEENETPPTPAEPEPLAWRELAQSYAYGSDLVSDGQTLYRVGGLGGCTSIYRYDGMEQDSWSLVTDQNPQCYSHRSPGEGNRSWYFEGKIIVAGHSHVGHAGGNTVTIYDLANDSWITRDLPVFEHFTYGLQSPLNARAKTVQIMWSEADTLHTQASSALDLTTLTWSTTVDRAAPIAPYSVPALGDTSEQYVFAMQRGDRYVQLQRYDLATQPADFSGDWSASATLDLGENDYFMDAARNYGSDVMAWDEPTGLLYLVATQKGTTLAYNPTGDQWYTLPARPAGDDYRDGHLAIAGGWLYSQNGDDLWALDIDEMPASAEMTN